MADYGLMQKLREIFNEYPNVLAAYLYGSYSVGRQGPRSDIDIAVVSEDRSVLPELSADIARRLNIPEERVSIVDLRLLDPALSLRIVRGGVEIINRGLDLNHVIPMDGEMVEVYELEEEMCKSWLRGDIRALREIIVRINEDFWKNC